MTFNILLDDLFKDIGACGKFQWILGLIVHCSRIMSNWAMYQMTFNGQAPGFTCAGNIESDTQTEAAYNFTIESSSCSSSNTSECTRFLYDGTMHTVVSEVSTILY